MYLPSEILKSQTQSLHRSVDGQPLFRRLIATDLTALEYGSVLSLLHIWLTDMMPHLQSLTVAPEQLPQRKLDALKLDLSMLRKVPNHSNARLTAVDQNFALGVLYVVEGSSLGARFLAPRIESALARSDVTRFYRLYGDETQRIWSETQQLLNTQLSTDEQLQSACDGAVFAFNHLLSLLQLESAPITVKGPVHA